MPAEMTPDLPDPWEVHSHQRDVNTPYRQPLEIQFGLPPRDEAARWVKLENRDTREIVLARLTVESPVRITALVFMPSRASDGFSSNSLRAFPTAAIEAAFTSEASENQARVYAEHQAGHGFDPSRPVGRPDGSTTFYARVALQYRYFNDFEAASSAARMLAELNEVSLPTAQRWITEARKRRLLPPGKRGRRTKKDRDAQD